MQTSEEDAPNLVARLIDEEVANGTRINATLVKPTTTLFISSTQEQDQFDFDVLVTCTKESPEAEHGTGTSKGRSRLYLNCQTGKLGSRDLRTELSKLPTFFETLPFPSPRILVCCPTGKDLAVGTALAILCLYADESGALDLKNRRPATAINKSLIKQRLSWITTSDPALNPSRATLQSVNAAVLATQDPKAMAGGTFQQTLPLRTKPSSSIIATTHPVSIDLAHIDNSQKPPDPPTSIFTTLPTSPWTFHRTLTSTLPTHPSGTVTGTATFTPCALPSPSPPTLLYAEEGTFTTTTGLSFSARRKYVYQLTPSSPAAYIVVKFFDDEALGGVRTNGEGIGGLFVEMGEVLMEGGVWGAKNREKHLCGEDLYAADWTFGGGMMGKGEGDVWWEVRYDVKGPKKDYESVTRYERVTG
jgi:tRNA A64-2'-O-ribosylphosphate transferase